MKRTLKKRVKECLKLSGGKRMGAAMRRSDVERRRAGPPIDSGVDQQRFGRRPKPGL